MDILAKVISLSGQAWAEDSQGVRRLLTAGDQLQADESLKLDAGTQIDLDFGNEQQLTLLGDHEITPNQLNEFMGLEPILQPLAEQAPIAAPQTQSSGESEGHGFFQLVRLGEMIEANGISPLTVARIQENLRPFGMTIPVKDTSEDLYEEHSYIREMLPRDLSEGIFISFQPGTGINGTYLKDDIKDGKVSSKITFDPEIILPGTKITITDNNGKPVLDKQGNPIADLELTPEDIKNGITIDVPVEEGQTQVEITVDAYDPEGNTGSSTNSKPIDTLTPEITVELEGGTGTEGDYKTGDIEDGYVSGKVTFDKDTRVGDRIKITDKNGKIIIDRPVTQEDIDNGIIVNVMVPDSQTEVGLDVTVTTPGGNMGKGSDTKNVEPGSQDPGSSNISIDETTVDDTNGKINIKGGTTDVAEGTDVVVTITDQNNDSVVVTVQTDANGDYTVTGEDISDLADGPLDIKAETSDNNGDPIDDTGSATLNQLDGEITVKFDDKPIDDPAVTKVSGTTKKIAPGESVELTFTDKDGITKTATAVVDNDGNYTTTVDLRDLVEGDINVEAKTQDSKGNPITGSDDTHLNALPDPDTSNITIDETTVDDTNGKINIKGKTTDVPEGTDVVITITDQNNVTVTETVKTDTDGNYKLDDLDISGLTDGPLDIKAETTDNTNKPIEDIANDTILDLVPGDITVGEVTVDNTAKEAVIKGSTDDVPENTQIEITITDGEGNTATGTTTVDASGNYTSDKIDTSGLVDGDFTVEVTTTDNNGNELTGADDGTTTGDTKLDQLDGAITVEFTDKPVTDAAVTKVTGTTTDVAPGKEVTLTFTSDNGGAPVVVKAVVAADGTYTTTVDLRGLTDGDITVAAEAVDRNGGTISDDDTVVLDAVAAAIVIDTTSVDDTVGTIDISGNTTDVAEGTDVVVTITDQNNVTVTVTVQTDANGDYTVSDEDITGLTDGPLDIKAETTDNNNKPIEDTTNDTILDHVPGKITVDEVTVDNTEKEVVIKGSTDDVPENTQVEITITDGEGNTATGTTTVDGNGNYTSDEIDTSGLVDGEFEVDVKTTDNNGNEQTGEDDTTTTGSTELDQLDGALTVGFDAAIDAENAIAVPVSGTSDDLAPGTVVNLTFTDQFNNQTTGTAVVAAGGTYSTTADLRGLTDSDITVEATAEDRNGDPVNANAATIKDALASDITIDTTTVNDATGEIDISGSTTDVAPGTDVDITITDKDGNVITATVTVQPDGSYSVTEEDISGLADGDLTIKAETTDNNGNTIDGTTNDNLNLVDGDITVAFDDKPIDDPAVTKVSGTTKKVAPGQSVELTFTDKDGITKTATAVVDNDGNYTTTVDLRGLDEGNVTVDAKAQDSKGNEVTGNDNTQLNALPDPDTSNITIDETTVDDANGKIDIIGSTTDVHPGETVTITIKDQDGDTVITTTTVNPDGSYDITGEDIKGLTDGPLDIKADTIDKNNKPIDDTATDALNHVPSEITVTTEVHNGPTDTGTIDVSGTTQDVAVNETVNITITDQNGKEVTATATTDANGEYEVNDTDISGLADGPLDIKAEVTDHNGNDIDGDTTDNMDFVDGNITIDNTVVDDGNETLYIDGTTEDVGEGETVTITIKDKESGTVTATTTVDGDGNYELSNIDISSLVDGPFDIEVGSTDNNGDPVNVTGGDELNNLEGAITVGFDATIDAANETAAAISGTTTDVKPGETVTLTINSSNGGPEVIVTAIVAANGTYTTTADVSGLTDGELTVVASAEDRNGLPVTDSDVESKDAVDGELTVDGSSVDSNGQTIDINGNTKDVNPGDTVNITIKDQDGNTVTTTATVQTGGSYEVTGENISSLVDGPLTIDASSTDNNGNPVNDDDTATLDHTNDTITVTLDNITSANESAVAVTGTTTDVLPGETVSLTFTDASNNTTTATATVDQNGNYQTSVDLSGFDDGNVKVDAKTTGRNGTVTDDDSANKDSTAPTLEITSTNDVLASGDVEEITFTFSEEVKGFDATDITVAGGTLTNLTTTDNITWTGDFKADGSGNISIKVPDNSYTDVAGNFGTGNKHAINPAPTISAIDVNGSQGGNVTVSEKGINNANENSETANGTLHVTAPTGLESITVGGTDISLAQLQALASTPQTITITGHGELTINSFTSTAQVNGEDVQWDIDYSYELTDTQDHKAANPDELLESIVLGVTAKDISGTGSITGTNSNLGVLVTDDVPTIVSSGADLNEALVTEAALGTTATVDFSDAFTEDFGADGAATNNSLTYELVVKDAASGLTDTVTGSDIKLEVNNDGTEIKGIVGGSDPEDLAFTITLNPATGEVTLEQSRALAHEDPLTPNDFVKIANGAINIKATATDSDGDKASAEANIGDRFVFKDDGPKADFASTEIVIDEANLVNGSNPDVDATKSSKVDFAGINFGADGVGDVQFTKTGAESTVEQLKAMGLKSDTEALQYDLSGDGHTLIAYSGTGRTEGDKIFTAEIIGADTSTPGYQFTLNGALDHLNEDKDQLTNLNLNFGNIAITDGDGDKVETSFNVKVENDKPDTTTPQEVTTDEDTDVTFNSNADATKANTEIGTGSEAGNQAPKFGTVKIEDNGQLKYEPNGNYSGEDEFTYTTTTDSGKHTYTVKVTVNPVADAPQLEANTAITTDEDLSKTLGLETPVITDATKETNAAAGDDHPERLGAITLTVKDAPADTKLTNIDGTTNYKNTGVDGEYKFVITDVTNLHLDGLTDAADSTVNYVTKDEYEAIKANPAENRHENFEVEISVDSYEVDASGAQISVDGTPVPSANSNQTIAVDVQAVTDDVSLVFDTDKTDHNGIDKVVKDITYTDSDKAAVVIEEDEPFKLNDILKAGFEDLDGSEVRSITIENTTEETILVNGTELTVGGSVTIDAKPDATGQTGGLNSFPDIILGGTKDFSGDLKGIKVTLNAQDTDNDSTGTIATKSAQVSLDLYVNPIAGDVTAENVETEEDTAVQFMKGIKLTDDNTDDGNERITKVVFEVPAGWEVTAPTPVGDWTADLSGTTYTITATNDSNLGSVLEDFKITPPAHSSKDEIITVKVTTEDSNEVNGPKITDTQENDLDIEVTVTPVAEKIADLGDENYDTDGNNSADLTMGENHVYNKSGSEDQPFEIGTDGSFNLSNGWSNEDGKWVKSGGWAENTTDGRSEDTFALLTPYSNVDANGVHNAQDASAEAGDKALEGSVFTYEGPSGTVTLPFAGEPVEIPMQYLDTVTFTGPKYWSGVVKMQVQAGTVDYDEDTNAATKLEISGEAWLTNLIVAPVANQVTLKVDAIVKTLEDTPIDLNILPTSNDENETFDVTISDIPKGAKITYKGTEYDTLASPLLDGLTDKGDGTFTLEIEDFDTTNQPELTPPKDSNETIKLKVEAESVDSMTYIDKEGKKVTVVQKGNTLTYTYEDGSEAKPEQTITGAEPHELPIEVQVQGVPDTPILEVVENKEYFEDGAENSADQSSATGLEVTLGDLISKLESGESKNTDDGSGGLIDDGSETITLRITDLPEDFTLTGAGPKLGSGDGAGRLWVVSQADLATVTINVPEHFSGTVELTVQPVVTENDNPSESFFEKQNIKFKVNPVAEASLNISSDLTEDIVGKLDLHADLKGDTDEFISQVRIKVSDVTDNNLTLSTNSDGTGTPATETIEGVDYYVFNTTGSNTAPDVYVKGPANFSGNKTIQLEYTVTDPVKDGTLDAGTKDGTVNHTLTFTPVTDKIDLSLATTDITGGTSTAVGSVITTKLDSAGSVKLNLKVAQTGKQQDGENTVDVGAKDIDGSEQLTHIVISGVPEGVSVKGAIETSKGQWLLQVSGKNWDAASNGTLEHELEFEVSGYANKFTDKSITITSYSNDTDATGYEKDSVEWKLTYEHTGDGDAVDLPEPTLEAIAYKGNEDTNFTLNEVIKGGVDSAGAGVDDYSVTVTIRTSLGDETTFSGMTGTQIIEDGESFILWTKTVEVTKDDDGQTKLEAMLADITVNLPKHNNSNDFGVDGKALDVNLSVHTHGISRDAQATTDIKITPVTDEINIEVSENSVDEGKDIELKITLPNEQVDGDSDTADWTVVGDLVYIHIADDGTGLKGQLIDSSGTALAVSGTAPTGTPTGGKVYAVNKDSLAGIKFVPDASKPYQTGKLDVTVLVKHQEANSGASKVSTSEGSLNIHPSNSGYKVDIAAEGSESKGEADDLIKVVLTDAVLNDAKEELSAAFVSGLPSGFTVWTDATGSEAMANNAGDGVWAIPLNGENLPSIHIKPPKNWSGTLEGLKLTVMSGHDGLEPTASDIEFDLVVNPSPDGMDMNPTLSFGNAGDKIALNLNASMKDPEAATGADDDQHTELTELSLMGFPDGEKVQFFIGDSTEPLDAEKTSYDEDTKTWTISGLSQDDLNNLKFLHAEASKSDIKVKGRTYEVDSDGNPYQESGDTKYSDWSGVKDLSINVSPTVPTSGDDFFLWDAGKQINGFGGEDTVQLRFGENLTGGELTSNLENIEVIDLSVAGENKITGLSIADVISITDDDNILKINGDTEDKVTLDESEWGTGTINGDYTVYNSTIDGKTAELQVQSIIID